MNPLSNVMGGWGIWRIVNGEQTLTTECIENVIMMIPFTSIGMWTFWEKSGQKLEGDAVAKRKDCVCLFDSNRDVATTFTAGYFSVIGCLL